MQKYPYRVMFTTSREQSEALELLAARAMTSVSNYMRQLLAVHVHQSGGAQAPRPRVNGEHQEAV
jgi:hypothetical protein